MIYKGTSAPWTHCTASALIRDGGLSLTSRHGQERGRVNKAHMAEEVRKRKMIGGG